MKTAGTLIGEWGINAGRKITCKCFALVFDNECYDAYVFLRAFSLSYFSWLFSLLLGYLGNSQHLRGRKLNVVIALRDIMEMQQEAHTAALVEMNHENSPVPYNLRELDGYKNAEENARFLVSRVTWLDGEERLKGKVLTPPVIYAMKYRASDKQLSEAR